MLKLLGLVLAGILVTLNFRIRICLGDHRNIVERQLRQQDHEHSSSLRTTRSESKNLPLRHGHPDAEWNS